MQMMDPPSVSAVVSSVAQQSWFLDDETSAATEIASNSLSEYLLRLGNEPTIGLHQISLHTVKAVPRVQDCRNRLVRCAAEVEQAAYEADDAGRAVGAMQELGALQGMKASLSKAIASAEALVQLQNEQMAAQGKKSGWRLSSFLRPQTPPSPTRSGTPGSPSQASSVASYPSSPATPPPASSAANAAAVSPMSPTQQRVAAVEAVPQQLQTQLVPKDF